MRKVIFCCMCFFICLLSACKNDQHNVGTSTETNTSAPVVAPVDNDPVAFVKSAMENHCRVKSQGYLELINFQKVDGVRAKDFRGVDTYQIKCTYQLRGVQNGGYLNQCRSDEKLMGPTVSLIPNDDNCFKFPVAQGAIYDIQATDISTYSPNFNFTLEKHEQGWVFAKIN